MSPKESVKNDRVVEVIKSGVEELGVRGLARAVNLSPAIVTRYMQGKVGEPSQATIEKLADYFRVSMSWLRGDTDLNFAEWEEVTQLAKAPAVISTYVITAVMDAFTRRGWPIPQHGEELREKYLGALRENVLRESENFKLAHIDWEKLTIPEIDKVIEKLNQIKIERGKRNQQQQE